VSAPTTYQPAYRELRFHVRETCVEACLERLCFLGFVDEQREVVVVRPDRPGELLHGHRRRDRTEQIVVLRRDFVLTPHNQVRLERCDLFQVRRAILADVHHVRCVVVLHTAEVCAAVRLDRAHRADDIAKAEFEQRQQRVLLLERHHALWLKRHARLAEAVLDQTVLAGFFEHLECGGVRGGNGSAKGFVGQLLENILDHSPP
jgi:hypothetical protein